MQKPTVAQKAPYKEEIKGGRIYWWCSCGLSAKQPYCDGTHKGTGMSPVKVLTDDPREVYFCGCKNSKNPPYCDGAHNKLTD